MNTDKELQQLEEFILDYNFKIETMKLTVKSKIEGTHYTSEQKWKLLSELSAEVLPSNPWVLHFRELEKNGIEYYDDLYKDRGVIIDVVNDIYDHIEACRRNGRYENIDMEQLKKEIIEQGYRTFVNDW